MALNQQFTAPTGRHFVARLEMADEPGAPRAFWDGTKNTWTADPSARLAATPDPEMPGVYLLQVPTSRTAAWAERTVWMTVIDVTDAPSQTIVSHGPAWMRFGDDGSRDTPSVDVLWPDGRTIHLAGAYARPATAK